MPVCKNCNSRIDKFNKDRCPICGVERPFEGVSSDTVEVTSRIDSADVKIDYHPRKRKTLLTLFALCGFLGIPFFYLRRHLTGIIYGLINSAVLATAIVLLILLTPLHIAVAIVLPIVVFVFFNTLVGLYYYNSANLKDGHGVFLI